MKSTLGRSSLVATAAAAICATVLLMPSAQAAAGGCSSSAPPPGAQALGYSRQVFCVTPTLADISEVATKVSKLYSGTWYNSNPAPLSMFSLSNGMLGLSNGAGLNTQTRKSTPGALPLLLASAGFYVEFAERLSDNDSDHWPAAFLMPQEHNGKHEDHMAGEEPGSERWMELDVDEGGFNPGHHGALINWWGKYPQYEHKNYSNDPSSTFSMDRTQIHVFGLSYDPVGKRVAWWVDGAEVGSVSSADVPPIIDTYHYYLIMGNQNHGKNHPYTLYIPYFSAWSGTEVPKPPSGVSVKPQ